MKALVQVVLFVLLAIEINMAMPIDDNGEASRCEMIDSNMKTEPIFGCNVMAFRVKREENKNFPTCAHVSNSYYPRDT